MLTIDLSQITEEEIKEATANLSKVVSNELNDAVKKGLNNSLDRYSQTFSRSVSTKLLSAIKTTVATDMAKEFTQYFHSKEFKDPIVKGLQSAVNSAFSNLAPVKMNVIPVIKPDTSATLHDLLQSGSTVTDRHSSPFMPVLSPDKAPTLADLSSSGSGTDILSSFDELSKSTAVILDNQGELNDVVKKAALELENFSSQLSDVNKKSQEMLAAEQKLLEAKQRLRVEDSVAPKEDKSEKKPDDNIILTKGLNFGRSLMFGVAGFLTKSVTAAVNNTNVRNREGFTATGTVVPSQAFSENATNYMRSIRNIKEKMEFSPILKMYGGEQAFPSYMALKEITGGFSKEELADPEKAAKGMEKMTASAVLAGMNLDKFAKKVEEGILVYGMNETASQEFIGALADQAKQLSMPFDSLQGYLNSANSSLRLWGHSLSESYGIATRFGKALEQGRISMGDIIEFASSLHKTGEGESVFLMNTLSAMNTSGSSIAQAIMSRSGGDPLAVRNLFRRASEADKGIAKELGVRGSDTDVQRELRQGVLKAVQSMAKEMAGENKLAQNEILRKLLPLVGISANVSEANLNNLMTTFGSSKGPSNWVPPKPKGAVDSAEKLVPTLQGSVGFIDKLKIAANEVIVTVSNKLHDDALDLNEPNTASVEYFKTSLASDNFKAAQQSLLAMQSLQKGAGLSPESNMNLSRSLSELASDLSSDLAAGKITPEYGQGVKVIVPILLKDLLPEDRIAQILSDLETGNLNQSTIQSITEAASKAGSAFEDRLKKNLNKSPNIRYGGSSGGKRFK